LKGAEGEFRMISAAYGEFEVRRCP
jgi:hypothetical protein